MTDSSYINSHNQHDPEQQYLHQLQIYSKIPDLQDQASQLHLTTTNSYALYNKPIINVEPQLVQPIQAIKEFLYQKIRFWKVTKNNNNKIQFDFKLPKTKFQNKKILDFKEQQVQTENIQQTSLDDIQLSSIWVDATFKVESRLYSYPYVWQINPWVFRGHVNRKKSLYFDLSITFRNLYYLPNRVIQLKKENKYQNIFAHPQIFMGIINILIGPIQILAMIFGSHGWYYPDLQSRCYESMELRRQQALYQKWQASPGFQRYFQIFVFLYYDEKKYQKIDQLTGESKCTCSLYEFQKQGNYKYLSQLDEKFNKEWAEIRVGIERSLKIDENENFYVQLSESKNKLQEKIILDSILPNQVKESLLDLIKCISIIKHIKMESDNELNKIKKTEFQAKLKKDHPIKSRFPMWNRKTMDRLMKQEKINQETQSNLKIVHEFKASQLEFPAIIYQDFIQFVEFPIPRDIRNLCKKEVKTPIVQRLVHMRKSISVMKRTNHKGEISYYIQKYREFKATSDCPGWKIQLFLIRWLAWSFNSSYWLLKQGIFCQYGLRALFGCQIYYKHHKIDSKTGIVSRDRNRGRVKPYCYLLSMVFEGITKSRNDFESKPDTGLCSKRVSRLCNLIENYIFRFLFVGILGVGILFPIIVLINSICCILFAFTTYLWMPVVLFLLWIVQWLFYDTDTKHTFTKWKDEYFRLPSCMQLLRIILYIAIKGVFQIVLAILMIVLHIILAIFFIIWGIIRFCGRTLYDCIMFICLKMCARVPGIDTSMAWKIAGPGVGRNYFYSIEDDDFYQLIQSEMEKLILDKYQQKMEQIINAPQNFTKEIVSKVFNNLGASFNSYNIEEEEKQLILKELHEQLEYRRKFYPQLTTTKIRFTSEEINRLFAQSTQIIQDYLKENDMAYIWDKYDIELGDFQKLTKKIWANALNSTEALDPIEDIEMRFVLKKNKNAELKSVTNALEGKANLKENQFTPYIKPKQLIQHKQVADFTTIGQIILILKQSNSQIQPIFQNSNKWQMSLIMSTKQLIDKSPYADFEQKVDTEAAQANDILIGLK